MKGKGGIDGKELLVYQRFIPGVSSHHAIFNSLPLACVYLRGSFKLHLGV